jgi:hypothetical protein
MLMLCTIVFFFFFFWISKDLLTQNFKSMDMLNFRFVFCSLFDSFYWSKSLTDDRGIIRHIEELLLIIEVAKIIVFGNALVPEMKKLGSHCLIEKVVME